MTETNNTRLPALVAGGKVQAIVPQTFEDAYRIARLAVQAGIAPRGLETPEKCCIAIMCGLEVGLTPMASLQSIAVINGRPAIYGDGAIGVVRASGLLEWCKETETNVSGQGMTATCEVKRKGEPSPVARSFSQADARTAGLENKDGPWKSYPRRMRQMRARSWALRDVFSDVLKGLPLAEEVQDIPPIKDVTPSPPPPADEPPPPPPSKKGKAKQAAEPAPPPPQETSDYDPVKAVESGLDDGSTIEWNDAMQAAKGNGDAEEKEWLKNLGLAFAGCSNVEQFAGVQRNIMANRKGKVSKETWAEAVAMAEQVYKRFAMY